MAMTWFPGGGLPYRGDAGGGLRVGQHFQTNGLPSFLQCDPPMGDATYCCRCVCVCGLCACVCVCGCGCGCGLCVCVGVVSVVSV